MRKTGKRTTEAKRYQLGTECPLIYVMSFVQLYGFVTVSIRKSKMCDSFLSKSTQSSSAIKNTYTKWGEMGPQNKSMKISQK